MIKINLKLRLVIGLVFFSVILSAQHSRPNVIYILADDLGIGDLSIYAQTKFLWKLLKQNATSTNIQASVEITTYNNCSM